MEENNEKKKPIYWKIVCFELLIFLIAQLVCFTLFFEKQEGKIIFLPLTDSVLMGWFVVYVLFLLLVVIWWSSPAFLESFITLLISISTDP